MHLHRFVPPHESVCPAVPGLVGSWAAGSSSRTRARICCVTLWDELARPAPLPMPSPAPIADASLSACGKIGRASQPAWPAGTA